ncbi:MAG: sodium-dependent transporter [Oscillospiraceae bacterium]|nr:sodium-dependent transporter [Oscillospiraceae bacterium]
METKNKGGFTGSIGFVLAAAGSAVGVGNIWRFPYLAARDGGGLFILVYIALVVTFGFSLLVTDIAIGRKTGKNALDAFGAISKKWDFVSKITFVIPAIIMTYYSVIGGWVLRYFVDFTVGNAQATAQDGYFAGFITSPVSPIVYMLVFLSLTAVVVYMGVDKGIEKFSGIVMPGLLVMVIGITVFSLTISHTDKDGTIRTGMQGLAVYLVPDFTGITFSKFLNVLLDAMSQLFFSLSVSMGIMITYGSYVKKDVDLNKSITQIEFFDTGVALLAGAMIIPAVYVFTGTEGMASGPSLMFIALPKVFAAMGRAGTIVGIVFFVMVAFAALTSCVSIMETLVAGCMGIFKTDRKKTSLVLAAVYAVLAAVICMGYNVFYFEVNLPNGAQAQQLLDVMDYISNSFLMPFIALVTSIFVGWVIKPKWITDEMQYNGEKFPRKKMYTVMVKYITPVIMTVLFLQSTGIFKIVKNMFV